MQLASLMNIYIHSSDNPMQVARHCDTDHTHIELTNDQFLEAIPDIVRATETHDVTTIRASTGTK